MSSNSRENTGRYEFKDEYDHKFWKGEIEGKAVTIHFGKVGTSGLRASREFTTVESAKKFLEERLLKKIREGFILVKTDSVS
ncbi:MAG: WGR domain-containing protein [Candidatus Thorarchaeota archaeon]|nr:MAG: WGR domain-containing protein [Candidatus Thorarchaeota archaeon]